MRKKILVVNNSLEAGGAERSCVNFLSLMPEKKYEVDVLLLFKTGVFVTQLPTWVKLLNVPFPFVCLAHRPKDWKFYIQHNPLWWIKKILRSWHAKHQEKLYIHQKVWALWRNDIPMFPDEYDIVIGGQEGLCNYYAMEKVKAKKTIIWIHNDYDKIRFNRSFDSKLLVKADIIATMSPIAKEKLCHNFPDIVNRIRFVENITNPDIIRRMASDNIVEKYFAGTVPLKIISCGRLAPVKAFNRAIMAASILKEKGVNFQWIIVGEGQERETLKRLIDSLHVSDVFHLIGLRKNPYSYMSRADILVVTSEYEGRPMVIDEAQILGKPIVTTNYPTVSDAVLHEETGLICEMNPDAIADAIIRLHEDKGLYNHIRSRLAETKKGNVHEIGRYIEMIEN